MGTNFKNDEKNQGLIEKLRTFLSKKKNQRILGGIGIFIGLILIFNIINNTNEIAQLIKNNFNIVSPPRRHYSFLVH